MNTDSTSALAHSVRSGDPGEGLVLCVHGQGGCAEQWENRVRLIAAHGLEAVAVELPLHGARRITGVDPSGLLDIIDYLRLVDTAAAELCEIVAGTKRGRPIGLLGHSLGAEVALVAMSRSPRISSVVAVGTVVSDPAWAGPASPWKGGNTSEFAEVLAKVTLLDRPQLLTTRDISYLHGTDDIDAPLGELLQLLERTGHQDRLTLIPGGHELTEDTIEHAAVLLAQTLNAQGDPFRTP
ncbi:MAG: alpha/beta hydrolase [Acidimicrobiia bacterium]